MNRRMLALLCWSYVCALIQTACTNLNGAPLPAWDLGSNPNIQKVSTYYSIVLTNDAVWNFGAHKVGRQFVLKVMQDATGGHVNTWPKEMHWSKGAEPSTTTTAGHYDAFEIVDDGVNYLARTYGLDFGKAIRSNALYFGNDSQNYVRVPGSAAFYQDPFTIECWFHAESSNTAGVGVTYASTYGWILWMRGQDDFGSQFACTTPCGTAYGNDWYHPLEDGQWHHLAGTYDGTNATLFVDGQKIGPADSCAQQIPNPGVDMYFQGGTVDEVRFSSIIRYTGNFTPATSFEVDSKTVAYWKFDETGGTVLHDETGNHNGEIHGAPSIVPGR